MSLIKTKAREGTSKPERQEPLRNAVVGFAILLTCAASPIAAAGVTVLHSFNYADGQYPEGRLLQAPDGSLIGTTYAGGDFGYGTVYSVTTDGNYQILHSFSGTDGDSLYEGVVFGADGNLYGTTPQGSLSVGGVSSNFGGSIFQLTPQGQFTTLKYFAGNGQPGGGQPGTLVDGGDGYFYGTNTYGGATVSGAGTVFRIAPDGSFAVLHAFDGTTEGLYPGQALTHAGDGNFYGTLQYGPNSAAAGAIFRMTPTGVVTLMHVFNGADGNTPSGNLVEPGDGNFYGTTAGGGVSNSGTVFRMAADGSITTLYSFNGADGSGPVGGLALGSDGNLYGLTSSGAANSGGTIFRVTPQGRFMTRHQLSPADGENPSAGPIFGSNGLLYGTTIRYGGAAGASGSVFQFDALTQQPADLQMTKFCYNEFDICMTPFNTVVGQPYTVQWTSSNLTRCTASGAWRGKKPPAGRLDVVPTQAGIFTYRLFCTGPGGSESAKVTVTVAP
jgi:uncharacterized repeat protein (TIGR03803 family)